MYQNNSHTQFFTSTSNDNAKCQTFGTGKFNLPKPKNSNYYLLSENHLLSPSTLFTTYDPRVDPSLCNHPNADRAEAQKRKSTRWNDGVDGAHVME